MMADRGRLNDREKEFAAARCRDRPMDIVAIDGNHSSSGFATSKDVVEKGDHIVASNRLEDGQHMAVRINGGYLLIR